MVPGLLHLVSWIQIIAGFNSLIRKSKEPSLLFIPFAFTPIIVNLLWKLNLELYFPLYPRLVLLRLAFIGLLFSALLPSSEAEAGAGSEPASGPAEPAPGSAETAAEPPEAGAEAASGVDGDSPFSLKKESPDQMVSGGRGWPRVGWPSSLEDH